MSLRRYFWLFATSMFLSLPLSAQEIGDAFSDSASDTAPDAITDLDFDLVFSPTVHWYRGADSQTELMPEDIAVLHTMTPEDCMDIYTPAGEQPEFSSVLSAANNLAKWLESPTHDGMAQLLFIQQEGSMPEPRLENRPILDVITMAVLGISVFDFAEDFLEILPGAIPAVSKTRKLVKHTKEKAKTIPVYVYRKKHDEKSIDLDLKRGRRAARSQDLRELDIAQAAIDGQQAIFNRQEESRLTKAIIEALTHSLEHQTNSTMHGWQMIMSAPLESIRTLLFTLWRNIASNDTLQQILGTFWDNMNTLPPERRTPKHELNPNDLRTIFAGSAVLEYSKILELKPGSYTIIVKHQNNNGHVIKKEKIKLQLSAGERYLFVNPRL